MTLETLTLRRVEEIVEGAIGGVVLLAMQVSELQCTAAELADRLEGERGVPAGFVEALGVVASARVRLEDHRAS